ncbi:alpha/beta hydrolase [Comamonadaceae bacterium M7527]|nr:alpha/beta hydrolase [Comamonadaceae bacterium M7527]
MNAQTEYLQINGPAGVVEVARDRPVLAHGGTRGTALIAHPHPLFGGTMHNKVVQTLARAFVQQGWEAVRFNFRGVENSAGVHDNGVGELDDMLAVLAALAPSGPLCLAGFSFGGFVAAAALAACHAAGRDVQHAALVGVAASRFSVPAVPPQWQERTLVVHGEADDTVPLSAAMDWARPQLLPVTVVPDVGHFFHGQLPLLKSLVLRHIAAPVALPAQA